MRRCAPNARRGLQPRRYWVGFEPKQIRAAIQEFLDCPVSSKPVKSPKKGHITATVVFADDVEIEVVFADIVNSALEVPGGEQGTRDPAAPDLRGHKRSDPQDQPGHTPAGSWPQSPEITPETQTSRPVPPTPSPDIRGFSTSSARIAGSTALIPES